MRLPRTLLRILLLGFLLPVVCPSKSQGQTSSGQSPPAEAQVELARQIHEVVEELQQLRRQHALNESSRQAEVADLERQISRLQSDLTTKQQSIEQERAEISRLESEVAENLADTNRSNTWLRQVGEMAVRLASDTRSRIANSAGARKRSRVATIDTALTRLESDEANERAEGIYGLLGFMGEEWTASRDVTLSNEAIVLDGGKQSKHAWVIGFGLAAQHFVSEDGDLVGISQPDESEPWQLDLPQEAAKQVRELLGIVRQNRPPAVAPIPLAVPSQK